MTRNITILAMAPDVYIDRQGRKQQVTPDERSLATNFIERISGLVDNATAGQVRLEVHLADRSVPYELRPAGSTTKEGTQTVVRYGCYRDWAATRFRCDDYEVRVFLGSRRLVGGTGGSFFSWGGGERSIWIELAPQAGYRDAQHLHPEDGLLHELAHQWGDRLGDVQDPKQPGYRGPGWVASPDRAGDYDLVPDHPTLGWTPFLNGLWGGRLPLRNGRQDGITPDKWALIPSRAPVLPQALIPGRQGVTIVPFRAVIPGAPWYGSDRVAPQVTPAVQPTTTTPRRPRG